MSEKLPESLRDYLREHAPELASRADVLWRLSEPIHARQTRQEPTECGRSHCEVVEKYIWRLITESGRLGAFRPEELFLLSCAACCHDFDKGLTTILPNDTPHGVGAGEFVSDHSGQLPLTQPEGTAIDFVVGIHDYQGDQYQAELTKLPESYSAGPSGTTNLQRLAVLLKAADVLHADNSRVSGLAVDPNKLQGRDRAKFLARQSTYGWGIEGSQIALKAYPKSVEQSEAVYGCNEYIREREWRAIAVELRVHGFPYELSFEVEDRHLLPKHRPLARPKPPGMDHYHEEDAAIFVGRDKDVSKVLSLVLEYPASKLVGPSGAGKSSLIHAGLKPRIKSLKGWECVVTRPDKSTGAFFTPHDFESVVTLRPVGEQSFSALCGSALGDCKKLLVVLDQFEDLAYFGWFDVEALSNELLEAQSQLTDLKLLFAYRDDVESTLAQLRGKLTHSSRGLPGHWLLPLGRDGARAALESLLNLKGIRLERHDKFMAWLLDELVSATDREVKLR